MFRLNHLHEVPPRGKSVLGKDDLEAVRRLLDARGARGLEDAQLVAVLLGPGGGIPPLEVAHRLCPQGSDPGRLARLCARTLARTGGISLARARRLLAALELGWRARNPGVDSPETVSGPSDLHPRLRRALQGLDRERFLALYLDTRHRVLHMETVSIGTLNASLVHPREVFKGAIALSAAALVVAHNHPSGCARPSGDDLELTARLDGCGNLLGIPLLDHLVVGGDEIISIREYGWPPGIAGKG